MPALTTSTTRHPSSVTMAHASRSLALLVAVTLLLCHGFFGAMHLLPANRGPALEVAPAQEATLTVAGSEHEDPAVGSVGKEYFAVLVVLLLGLFLGPLLRRIGSWCARVALRPNSGRRVHVQVAYPARGPTGPLLQVFRL